MKIFNIKPIKVMDSVFNQQYLAESQKNYSYESGFGLNGVVFQSLNTLIITFDILHTIDKSGKDIIIPSKMPDKFTIHIEEETANGYIFLSYSSFCQFNFESEGYDADVMSITEFLDEYSLHTKKQLSQYGSKSILEYEDKVRMNRTFKADAYVAIENLRENNMYEF